MTCRSFLVSRVSRYCELSGARHLKRVATPFLAESGEVDEIGRPASTCPTCGGSVGATACQACQSETVRFAEADDPWASGVVGSAGQAQIMVSGAIGSTGAGGAVGSTGKASPGGTVGTTGHPSDEWDHGELRPIAARVLKVLYAARMARYDLLRAVNSLACNVTRWAVACDTQLHRLMCYIHHSLDLRLVGWVGDQPEAFTLQLFADADLRVAL